MAPLLLLLLAACGASSLQDPEPRQLTLNAEPAAVLRAAAEIAAALGWLVPTAGVSELLARRTAAGDTNGEWMRCANGVGATGDGRRVTRELSSTLLARVEATAAGDRTVARIQVIVDHALSPLPPPYEGPMRFSAHECVSSGAFEAQLADSLAVRHGG